MTTAPRPTTAPGDGQRRRVPPPPAPRTRRRGYGRRRILAVASLVAVAAALYLINAIFQPFHGDGHGSVAVTIPRGADAGEIGDLLAQSGVVDSGTFFSLNATLSGRRDELKPGRYTFARGMAYGDALDALVQGPKAKIVKTFDLTIPEGRSRREIVPLIERTSITGDYLKATADAKLLPRARTLGAPRGTKTLEGFLFPATYPLVDEAPASDLAEKQLDAFEDNFSELKLGRAQRLGPGSGRLSRYDIVIIASMVEREARLARERPLIAAVIYNRLRRGIPLGIDATIRYAENNWTRPLRQSELNRDGPYNTRLHRGLPPTPIGNPGLASLKAAAKPANVSYLYYVVKPGRCGEHAFSSTDRKFQQDRERYDSARARRGGRSPTKC